MARRKCTPLRDALSRMFPEAELQRLAASEGVVQRQRKVEIVALFWVLILSVGYGKQRTLADLRRSYEKATGCRLSASAFYDRFNPRLTRLLKTLMEQALESAAQAARRGRALFGQIREVLCIDSTVVRLHDALAGSFPACRTNHTQAAAKLHTVLNVRGQGPQSVKLTSERVHDGPVLRAGGWVHGRLLLFDLGYFRYHLFARIGEQGGYFLTRLKDNANPTIVALHRRHRGRAIDAVGRKLRELRDRLQRRVFDAEAEVDFRRRAYRGQRHRDRLRVRVVALRDDIRGGYHWYVTNLPPELVPAEDLGALYSARWSIELLFREMKSCYRLDSIPSRKRPVVEALLYAAVLTVLASHALLRAVRQWAHLGDRQTPLERWARLFVCASPELLAIVLDPVTMAHFREQRLLPFLAQELPDPNRKRQLLLDRAGLLWQP
jgi:putative transposase